MKKRGIPKTKNHLNKEGKESPERKAQIEKPKKKRILGGWSMTNESSSPPPPPSNQIIFCFYPIFLFHPTRRKHNPHTPTPDNPSALQSCLFVWKIWTEKTHPLIISGKSIADWLEREEMATAGNAGWASDSFFMDDITAHDPNFSGFSWPSPSPPVQQHQHHQTLNAFAPVVTASSPNFG